MKHQQFQPQKNDVLFAFLMAVVLAVTIVGEVAGGLDLAGGRAVEDSAKARGQSVALRSAWEPLRPVAPSGARE